MFSVVSRCTKPGASSAGNPKTTIVSNNQFWLGCSTWVVLAVVCIPLKHGAFTFVGSSAE